jgi:hypothetical protein
MASNGGQVDHTTLSNISTNTHAQINTFISSKGTAGGLASLNSTSNVPTSQLDNITSTTVMSNINTNMGMMLNFFRPWSKSGWSTDLNAIKSTRGVTQVPVYEAAINGGSNNTYFVNIAATSQPLVLEITFQCTCSVLLMVDAGNSAFVLVVGTYILEASTHSILLLAPTFTTCAVATGTYTDQWSQGNSITLGSAMSVLRFYLGIGFPSGPMAYPKGSPFAVRYTLDNSPYLANGSTVQIQGWC